MITRILSTLCRRYRRSRAEDIPRVDITDKKLNEALSNAIPDYGEAIRRTTLDADYYAAEDSEQVQKAIENTAHGYVYETDVFDCENFAMLAASQMGSRYGINTVGVVVDWSAPTTHAYNVVVYGDSSVEFVDPQNGKWFTEPWEQTEDLYDLRRGRIIL
jgi:hypothetical protein